MKRHVSSPAQNRLEDRLLFFFQPLILVVLVGIAGRSYFQLRPTGVLAVAWAAFLSLPIIAVIVLFGLYLGEETDEFQKSLRVRALLWSTGVTLSAATFWGSLETLVHVPTVSIWSVQVLFFAVLVLASAILRWRYR